MSDIKQHLTHSPVNRHTINRNVNNEKARPEHDLEHEPKEFIKQNSSYVAGGQCAPDNNPFWEDGGNPLSSKGN